MAKIRGLDLSEQVRTSKKRRKDIHLAMMKLNQVVEFPKLKLLTFDGQLSK